MTLPGILQCIDPPGDALPLVFDLPHSGREYPEDFGSTLAHDALCKAEDAYVDKLLLGVESRGVSQLIALFPRAYIDVNRDERDIDEALLDSAWPGLLNPGSKTELGIGLIRRIVQPGAPIYDRKLTVAEVRHRIERYYRPYRNALTALLEERRRQHGRVLHIDWHSMKSAGNRNTPDGEGAQRPDFVLGDLHGQACDARVTQRVADCLREIGYRVTINDPYAGGDIVRSCGRSATGINSLQIEMNRRLYLNEETWQVTDGFTALAAHLTGPLLDLLIEVATAS